MIQSSRRKTDGGYQIAKTNNQRKMNIMINSMCYLKLLSDLVGDIIQEMTKRKVPNLPKCPEMTGQMEIDRLTGTQQQ